MANLMNPVIPQSITIRRNNDFTVKVNHMSIDAPTHWNIYIFCHLQHFIHHSIASCHASGDLNAALQSFDLSRGSLPPADSGSCEFEMFVHNLRGVVTPMSATQFITSSGPPVTMQLDMAIAMAGLSTEQVEEIFLLTQ